MSPVVCELSERGGVWRYDPRASGLFQESIIELNQRYVFEEAASVVNVGPAQVGLRSGRYPAPMQNVREKRSTAAVCSKDEYGRRHVRHR